MNLSRKWLKEFVDVTVSDKEFADQMTLSGSKVETYTDLGAEIKNVCVGRIVEMKRHENSDHMFVCQVDVGEDAPIQIVTGAQNQKEGDLVVVARHNSYLPGGVHITKGKLRGEMSNGMLCSLQELGLTTHNFPYAIEDGLLILQEDCKPGDDIIPVLGLDDTVVEFEITNNRPDCFSVIGLAREAAATFDKPLKLHDPVVKGSENAGSIFDRLDVEVPAEDLCPRYTARMVKNVKIGPSPMWMRERLHASGVRPINNIVDITNYVMLEYGQPMHAFDYRYVSGGKIVVRRAEEGETLRTLDGVDRPIKPGMLVIADEHKPVGLAGIMGGENSEIVDDTVDVVFESANFNGTSIRQTALALGMSTDASGKYAKGLDPLNTMPAVQRACELVELLGAGEVMDGIIDVLNYVPQPVELPLEPEKINGLLGTDISTEEMVSILTKLDFELDGMTVKVPSWRQDIACMADLAEEVGRFHGYDNMPSTVFGGETAQGGFSESQNLENQAGVVCRALGFSEIYTYSFISPSAADLLRWPADSALRQNVRILNPLGEDTSVMRTTTLHSMLETLARNKSYRNKKAKLYELAKIYLPVEGQTLPNEPKVLTLGTYGANETFFTLKGEIEAILAALNVKPATYEAQTGNPSYHPGRCAELFVDGVKVGVFGQIHPLVAANYDMDGEIFAAELDFTTLLGLLADEARYVDLPRFPAVTRDLALVCEEHIPVSHLANCIKEAGGKLLTQVELFDIYRGANIPDGKKSVAFSLELRAEDRTLTDADSDGVITSVLKALEEKLGAVRR
jgi:phenylalanyl-tRNA synthetase beta chain